MTKVKGVDWIFALNPLASPYEKYKSMLLTNNVEVSQESV